MKVYFFVYATSTHAYRVFNKRLMIVEESMHVVFDETNPKLQDQVVKNAYDEDILLEKKSSAVNESTEKKKQSTETIVHNNLPKEWSEPKGLSKDNIIDDINQGVSTILSLLIVNTLHFCLKLKLNMWMML